MKADSIFVVKIEVTKLNGVPADRDIRNLELDFLVNKDVLATQEFVVDQKMRNSHRLEVKEEFARRWKLGKIEVNHCLS